MKITLSIFGFLLVVVGIFWFQQENNRLKINTENETVTGIDQRNRSAPDTSALPKDLMTNQ